MISFGMIVKTLLVFSGLTLVLGAFIVTLLGWTIWPRLRGWGTVVLLAALILIIVGSAAPAHDHWIRDGKYLDETTGQHCCNEDDCKIMTDAEISTVEPLSNGALSVLGLTFQKGSLHKSEDGLWYRCANRCVFRPVEG